VRCNRARSSIALSPTCALAIPWWFGSSTDSDGCLRPGRRTATVDGVAFDDVLSVPQLTYVDLESYQRAKLDLDCFTNDSFFDGFSL